MSRVARRDFLKTVPAAAGVYLAGGAVIDAEAQTKAPRPADVRLSGTAYQPVPDYPIRPKRYSEVTLTDDVLEAEGRDQRGGHDSVRGAEGSARPGEGSAATCSKRRSCR